MCARHAVSRLTNTSDLEQPRSEASASRVLTRSSGKVTVIDFVFTPYLGFRPAPGRKPPCCLV